MFQKYKRKEEKELKNIQLIILAFMVVLLGSLSFANAAPVTFFGEDLGLGEGVRLGSFPNSNAARAAFFSNLVGVGTEDFEGFAEGAGSPLLVSFGADTATLTGGGAIDEQGAGTNGYGRYPTSGTKYWETNQDFLLTFNNPQSAFGFYGIDIGDFLGQLSITYANGAAQLVNIPHTIDGLGGSVLYFGFYDIASPFTSIAFSTTTGVDWFGFDDFSIGRREQVCPVPEPGTLSLLGLGLFGLLGFKRKRS